MQDKTIENLRIPLTLLVIFCHAGIGGAIRLEDYAEDIPSSIIIYDNICNFIHSILGQLAVPTFFIISGFLFFNNIVDWSWKIYQKKLKSRIWTLLIPYFVWVSLYAVFKSYGSHTNIIEFIQQNGILHIFGTNYGINSNIWGLPHLEFSPLLGPFWYMQQLMIMCILSPIIFIFCRKLPKLWLIALYVIYLADLWLTGVALLYFSIGACMSLYGYEFGYPFIIYKKFIFCIATLFLFLLMLFGWHTDNIYTFSLNQIFIPIGSASIICLCSLFTLKNRWFNYLTQYSFFVYAAHMFLVPYTYSAKVTKLWNSIPIDFCVFLLRPMSIYLVLSCIAILIQKRITMLYKILCGR